MAICTRHFYTSAKALLAALKLTCSGDVSSAPCSDPGGVRSSRKGEAFPSECLT
jgi:hypothetical protein